MKTLKKKSKGKSIKKYVDCKPKDIECQKKLVLQLLRDTPFPKNTSRKNIMRTEHKENKVRYEGFVLGIVTSWAGKGSRSGYRKMLSMKTREPKYKKLFNETKKLMKLKDPKFKFTSIQYNKNNRAARHRDAKNVGVSYILGLGDYTGGELIIFDENEKNPVKHDIRGKFNTFDGSKYPHETAPFKGERYTLVFYST